MELLEGYKPLSERGSEPKDDLTSEPVDSPALDSRGPPATYGPPPNMTFRPRQEPSAYGTPNPIEIRRDQPPSTYGSPPEITMRALDGAPSSYGPPPGITMRPREEPPSSYGSPPGITFRPRQEHANEIYHHENAMSARQPQSETPISSSTVTATMAPTSTSSAADQTTSQATITSEVPSSTSKFVFIELSGSDSTFSHQTLPTQAVLNADYKSICSGRSCFEECQDPARAFHSQPYLAQNEPFPPANFDVSLFGVCSNLANASSLATGSSVATDNNFLTYFPLSEAKSALPNVTTHMAMCLVDTCEKTRDPTACNTSCSFDRLRSNDSVLNIAAGVYPCLYSLCYNTCSLPYADRDIFGIGLIASYITQAMLVLLLAVFILFGTSKYLHKNPGERKIRRSVSKQINWIDRPLKRLLLAQNYFGISSSIASFFQNPNGIDQLNGYALLSLAITGFMPGTFTLMLLYSHDIRSKLATALTVASWLCSSVLFWILFRNLQGSLNNPEATVKAMDQLFQIDSCGGGSAMSVCKQTFGTMPLEYLSNFYNYWDIPNIHSVPVLWVLTTVVLLIIVTLQLREIYQRKDEIAWLERSKKADEPDGSPKRLRWRFLLTLLGSILFGLAFGYQARMVTNYWAMDVIDRHGWSFGQIVALLFWTPSILDCLAVWYRERNKHSAGAAQYVIGADDGSYRDEGKASISPTGSDQTLTPFTYRSDFNPDIPRDGKQNVVRNEMFISATDL